MIHQTGSTLGTQHATVDRMIAIAVDVDRLSVLEVDANAAAAGTHVAGGRGDLVGDWYQANSDSQAGGGGSDGYVMSSVVRY